jgi:hypothetical protein
VVWRISQLSRPVSIEKSQTLRGQPGIVPLRQVSKVLLGQKIVPEKMVSDK